MASRLPVNTECGHRERDEDRRRTAPSRHLAIFIEKLFNSNKLVSLYIKVQNAWVSGRKATVKIT